jgi:hypothetical protein
MHIILTNLEYYVQLHFCNLYVHKKSDKPKMKQFPTVPGNLIIVAFNKTVLKLRMRYKDGSIDIPLHLKARKGPFAV